MKKAPSTTLSTRPMPPRSETPPMTQAAINSSAMVPPRLASPDLHARGEQQTRHRGQEGAGAIGEEQGPGGVDAGELGRLDIAADRVEMRGRSVVP